MNFNSVQVRMYHAAIQNLLFIFLYQYVIYYFILFIQHMNLLKITFINIAIEPNELKTRLCVHVLSYTKAATKSSIQFLRLPEDFSYRKHQHNDYDHWSPAELVVELVKSDYYYIITIINNNIITILLLLLLLQQDKTITIYKHLTAETIITEGSPALWYNIKWFKCYTLHFKLIWEIALITFWHVFVKKASCLRSCFSVSQLQKTGQGL